MKSFQQFQEDAAIATNHTGSSVVATGDDTTVVPVKKKKKKTEMLTRELPSNTK